MKIADLFEAERMALIALLRCMVRMDGVFSPGEAQALTKLAQEIGSKEFWATMQEIQQRVLTPDDLVPVIACVERRDVKEWIYGVLLGVAAIDGIVEPEVELLEWLQEVWELDT